MQVWNYYDNVGKGQFMDISDHYDNGGIRMVAMEFWDHYVNDCKDDINIDIC